MTTEIAILNRAAVALAADSAVTISGADGNQRQISKIYANANKLFELVKGAAVGVMIFNSADVAAVPWESVIKAFRDSSHCRRRHTLHEYAEDLKSFTLELLTRSLTPDEQRLTFRIHVASLVMTLLEVEEPNAYEVKSKTRRKQHLEATVDKYLADWGASPIAGWAGGLDERAVGKAYEALLLGDVPEVWCDVKLSKRLRLKLANLGLTYFLRSPDLHGPWSGLVVAGFGDQEIFPSLHHMRVAGVFEGRLIWFEPEVVRITPTQRSIIRPFAQTDDAQLFLLGIDPQISDGISAFWRSWTEGLHTNVRDIAEATLGANASELDEFAAAVQRFLGLSWGAFGDFMKDNFHNPRSTPITQSAEFLSKGEIADLAETLVELTSLRNRVSMDRQETVGGATDVAVISKGDGFVWVKRKHYFDTDRNPAWPLRSALGRVGWAQRERQGEPK